MPITGAPPSVALYDAYICVRDVKAQFTDGGTFTQDAWQTRDINDEQADTANICSINSNQITLAAGTYRCMISCPAFKVAQHKTRLYNITDSVVLLGGTSEFAYNVEYPATRSFIVGRFTLAAEKVLEVQHRCNTTCADNGFGVRCDWSEEVYTVAEFWREA